MSDATVTITGHHRFAKSLLAIKAVRKHTGWTLAPAKKAIDPALAGERVELEVPAAGRDVLMKAFADLGWSTQADAVEVSAKAPEPPGWWLRVKGLARVVAHLPSDDGRALRMRLAMRDCTIEPGDSVGWVMHENFVLGVPIVTETLTHDQAEASESFDNEDDVDFTRQLYPVGRDLEVLAPAQLGWPSQWRLVREALWSALSHLPTELVDNPEGGSLAAYREYMDHNELGLAHEELVGLAEVNAGSSDPSEALREARRLMLGAHP